jgi:AcrR family transcriptional regulator
MGSSHDDTLKAGLRERKKARTRSEIQRRALALFRERGYEATTVGRIAEAAEVSESTFFRYFPTKEDVVLWDGSDLRILEAFASQPPGSGPVGALRDAIRETVSRASAEERAELRARIELLLGVPPLRAALFDRIAGPMTLLAEAVASWTGRRPEDPAVRALAGAMMGVGLSALFAAAEDPEADIVRLIDGGLAQLEAGFPM